MINLLIIHSMINELYHLWNYNKNVNWVLETTIYSQTSVPHCGISARVSETARESNP